VHLAGADAADHHGLGAAMPTEYTDPLVETDEADDGEFVA